jgi:plastocyanin
VSSSPLPARRQRTLRPSGLGAAALGLTLVTLTVALAACSSPSAKAGAPDASRGSSSPQAGTAVITIANFAFNPDTLRVAPGAVVTVHNEDGVTHTVTSLSGAFNTGDIPAGTTVHFSAPTTPGNYPYRCNIHQFMTGTLVVT